MARLSLKSTTLIYMLFVAAIAFGGAAIILSRHLADDPGLRNDILVSAFFLVSFCTTLVIVFVSRWVIGRIETIRQGIDSILLTGDMGRRVSAAGSDEISKLAHSFNALMQQNEESVHKIEESERKYQTLADAVPVGIFRGSPEGMCRYVNRQLSLITGYEPSEFFSRGWENIIHPDDKRRVLTAFQTHLESRKPAQETFRFVRKNGQVLWCLMQSNIEFAVDGSVLGHAGTFLDITVSKENELELEVARSAAEQANRTKSVFLANMSHELRTPLNSIIGFTELMKSAGNSLPEGRRAEFLDTVLRNGRQLSELVSGILDLSRIEGDDTLPRFSLAVMNQFVSECTGALRQAIEKKNVKFSIEISKDGPIATDLNWLRQIVTHLLVNAIKFTQQTGDIGIKASVDSNWIDITVWDTGIGIEPDKHAQIFERFYQVEQDFSRSYQGTGLGLSLVKILVERMEGQIEVESAVGRGSRFHVRIKNRVGQLAVPDLSLACDLETLSNLRILLVEDNPANADLFDLILQKAGAGVVIAQSGQEGIDLVLSESFDAVLLDIGLPDIDGLEVLKVIRADAKTQNLPVIALTAHAMSEHRDLFLSKGCDGYISKPVKVEGLPLQVLQMIRRARQERRAAGTALMN